MKLTKFVKNCFNKHLPHFYILVLDEENNIYNDFDENIIISQSSDVKYQMIKILEFIDFEPKMKFKVQLPNSIEGYFAPENSIIVIPKKRTQVVISKNTLLSNDLNLHFKVDLKYLDSKKDNVLYSKQYTIFRDKIYESLILNDEIIGFVEQENINELHRYEKSFKILNDTTTYKDSSMTNATTVLKNKNKTFKSQYVIPSEDKIRLKQNGKNIWIDRKNTDLDINVSDEIFYDLNELFIESILFQYQQKLESYHNYYSKLVDQNR